MHKKFELNLTKIKGGCHSGRKVVTHNSKSDLPLRFGMISISNAIQNNKWMQFEINYCNKLDLFS